MSEELEQIFVDSEDEAAALEKQKRERDQELEDIRLLLKSTWGHRFFRRILSEGKVFSSTFSTDHASASFLEGHRNLALKFFSDVVEACPEKIPSLMVEGERQPTRV